MAVEYEWVDHLYVPILSNEDVFSFVNGFMYWWKANDKDSCPAVFAAGEKLLTSAVIYYLSRPGKKEFSIIEDFIEDEHRHHDNNTTMLEAYCTDLISNKIELCAFTSLEYREFASNIALFYTLYKYILLSSGLDKDKFMYDFVYALQYYMIKVYVYQVMPAVAPDNQKIPKNHQTHE